MRVLQRLAGRENPLQTLKVYEHTLTFRQGIAEIEELTEREIHRLRAFGFRVERDTGPKRQAPKPRTNHATTTPPPEDNAEVPAPENQAEVPAPEDNAEAPTLDNADAPDAAPRRRTKKGG